MDTAAPTPQAILKDICTPSDCLAVNSAGELLIEGCPAPDLIARFGSPLFVLSDSTLRQNVRRIQRAFERNWAASVNVMYAIKCNPNFAVRAVVHEEGAGGDCFGIGELEATFAGGADPQRQRSQPADRGDSGGRHHPHRHRRLHAADEGAFEGWRRLYTSTQAGR